MQLYGTVPQSDGATHGRVDGTGLRHSSTALAFACHVPTTRS